MQVVGVCRFSHVGRGDWKAYQGKDLSEMEAVAMEQAKVLFAPERMEGRLRTFETLTLASIKAQSDPDFLFVVLSSSLMPKAYRDRLQKLCDAVPQVRLVFSGLCTVPEAQRSAFKKLALQYEDTLQFRLDDDDCIPAGFIEAAKAAWPAATDSPSAFVATLSHCLYSVTHGPAAGVYHWPVDFLAAGLALRHPRKSIYEFAHFALEKRFPSIKIADMFSLVTHNGNNDTTISLDRMLRRGMRRVEGDELKAIVEANFSFLSPDARRMAGLTEHTAAEPEKADDEQQPDWLKGFSQRENSRGFFIYDKQFALQFSDRRSNVLYVSFDNLASARSPERLRDPWGYSFAANMGWSHLGVMTYQAKWFRHAQLFKELEALRDRKFFKGYDQVIFSGTSMGGYAACAFSSLAPGCIVVAFSPQSTLDSLVASWDGRYPSGTAADWSGPFADAAVELGSARKAWIIYDPMVEEDERHAKRLSGPNVEMLRARYSGHFTAQYLRQIGVLSTVMREAAAGNLSADRFRELYSSGKEYRRYLLGLVERSKRVGSKSSSRRLAAVLKARGRPVMASRLLAEIKAE